MFKIDVNDYLEKSAMRKARFGGYEPDDVRRAMRELCAAYEQALADAEKQQQESRAESDALRRRVEMQKALAAYEPKSAEGAALNQEASNLVRLAALEARRTGKSAAGVEHILLTMLREKHNAAGRLLLMEKSLEEHRHA